MLVLMLSLSGCGSLFFLPSKQQVLTPDQIGLAYADINLNSADGVKLHGWLLKPQGELRGTLYFLHGNAENISTHIASVMWLPAFGYEVFLLDYRGYGQSTGDPDVAAALADIETGYRWLEQRPETRQKPLFLLGQSLGAALTATFAGSEPDLHQRVSGVILDAAFSSFRGIAREKLNDFWLTWPLQYPLSWLVPGSSYDPITHVAAIAPTPLLIIHSQRDAIIPFHHGQDLFAAAASPKYFLPTQTAHIGTFGVRQYRDDLLQFLSHPQEGLTDLQQAQLTGQAPSRK